MNKNSLLTMKDLSVDDILNILNDARAFYISTKDWQLPMRKALVANLFLSPRPEPIIHLSLRNIRSAVSL